MFQYRGKVHFYSIPLCLSSLAITSMVIRQAGFEVKQFLHAQLNWAWNCIQPTIVKDVARTLKKLRISKGNYWIKQWFSSIASLFKIGTSLKRKNYAPRGSIILSLKSSSLWYRKSHLPHKVTSHECDFFSHVRKCVMGATPMIVDI